MTIDWTEIAKLLNIRDIVLLIVIFFLLRLLNGYSKEIFSHNATMARLTNLLETLVFNRQADRNQ